ncbi:Vesicle-associated membrane protein 7B [Beauveria bassiana]|uniref:Synaptobrevin homolog YKT6 n=1 Tax=Beauveria bassiana TaxID=176275 RepID=A0A2N6NJY3_BEABA|nr:Vesicle-associated membrane protein 7B [Beauveria bassiana]
MASSSTPTTPLLYSCVAHQSNILSECTSTTSAASQASSLASLILPKINHTKSERLTYTYGSNQIHYMAESASDHPNHPSAGGLTFLVVADAALGRQVRRRFFAAFPATGNDFADMPSHGAGSFNGTLKTLMVEYSSTSGSQTHAIVNVRQGLDHVKAIATKNIKSLGIRGDEIHGLMDKTAGLNSSAQAFYMSSRGIRRRMWWKNTRITILIGVVIILIIILAMVIPLKA